ncbi:hypothetical protein CCR75_009520 [Bremia lactucae]|uniref:FYVE-type domain-containing protein n=1 Tax=Bremia lactucae TaxID=4779 RepID=A0A976FJN6_BRELC|nr:hypothetical protein CCR75_009520 [Bremia lactucae]
MLATQLLSNTLRDYDIHSADPRQRRMSRRRWKPVKTRDNLTVYKERYPASSSQEPVNHLVGLTSKASRVSMADRVSIAFRGNEWTEPKLLVTAGWIEGKLDDVMYGVSSPDAQSMLLKATVVKNTLINGGVLACIDAPCDADPFRFLGIKWFVKGPPNGLQTIVKPRDLVFIEATGITTRPNGERIGYQILHSVDPPQCRDMVPQSQLEVTRGRISSCSIFREVPTGLGSRHYKVDVYVKGYVEAHGKLLDYVALNAASTGFISSWNTVECANLKKLMWCFRQQPEWERRECDAHRAQTSRQYSNECSRSETSFNHDSLGRSHQELLDLSSRCGTCVKRLTKLSGNKPCALCCQATCSRCRVPRTLKEVSKELWMRKADVLVCKRCVLRVDNIAAVDVARAEVNAHWLPKESVHSTSNTYVARLVSSAMTADARTPSIEDEYSLSVLSPTTDLPIDSFRGVKPPKEIISELNHPIETKPELSDRECREQIWSQMVELRMVAESIYNLSLEASNSLDAVRPSCI